MEWPESLGEPGPAWRVWEEDTHLQYGGVVDIVRAGAAIDELVGRLEELQGENNAYVEILEPKIAAVAPDTALIFPMATESIDILAERVSSELTERVEKADAKLAKALERAEKAEAELKRARARPHLPRYIAPTAVVYCVHCGRVRVWARCGSMSTTGVNEWELQDCSECGEEA